MEKMTIEKFKQEYNELEKKYSVEKKHKKLLAFLRDDFDFVATKIVNSSVRDFFGVLEFGGVFDDYAYDDFKKLWDKIRKEKKERFDEIKKTAKGSADSAVKNSTPAVKNVPPAPAMSNVPPAPAVEKPAIPVGIQKKNEVLEKAFGDMTIPEKKLRIVSLLGFNNVDDKIKSVLNLALEGFIDLELTQSIIALTDFRNPDAEKFNAVYQALFDFLLEQLPNPNQKLLSAVLRSLLLARFLDSNFYGMLSQKTIQKFVGATVRKQEDCLIVTTAKF